ncbi:hypothetical protein HYV11_04035 [Candidatus Dependentiae bacterium]|nr:hypothetical protein [Candidatus Dependentiae bacterium]
MKKIKTSRIIILWFGFVALLHGKEPIPHYDPLVISEDELLELIKESQRDDSILSDDIDIDTNITETRNSQTKKPFTFMVFIAADNDLHYFAWKNIKQMEKIGSNSNINIVIQLNTPGHSNPTKRYLIKQGKRLLVQDQSFNQKLNSGSPHTLIDFVQWTVNHYPAEEYALVIWDHATGDVDPGYVKTINPCNLFYRNPTTNMLEIDRGLSYINLILQCTKNEIYPPKRGMCFDETFKSYINNHDFEFALHEIFFKVLNQKKLAIIAFDACLMSMIGIACAAKKYAHYMVGSQEVEYGTGWDYEKALHPFLTKSLNPHEFSQHLVHAYEQAYYKITNEYTQSALNLSLCDSLEKNINLVATLLIEAFGNERNQTTNILRKSKSTQYCTCFDEPSYIDLGHFYKNILQHLQYLTLSDKKKEEQLQQKLKEAILEGLNIIQSFVIANKTGQKLKNAHGVSIYFPEHTIVPSYLKSTFALHNNWSSLLEKYIFG